MNPPHDAVGERSPATDACALPPTRAESVAAKLVVMNVSATGVAGRAGVMPLDELQSVRGQDVATDLACNKRAANKLLATEGEFEITVLRRAMHMHRTHSHVTDRKSGENENDIFSIQDRPNQGKDARASSSSPPAPASVKDTSPTVAVQVKGAKPRSTPLATALTSSDGFRALGASTSSSPPPARTKAPSQRESARDWAGR